MSADYYQALPIETERFLTIFGAPSKPEIRG
jgi:hypothetical protein